MGLKEIQISKEKKNPFIRMAVARVYTRNTLINSQEAWRASHFKYVYTYNSNIGVRWKKSRQEKKRPYISIEASSHAMHTLIYLTLSSPSRILTFNLHICHSYTEAHPSPSPMGGLTPPQRTTLTFDFQVETPSTHLSPQVLNYPA